MSEPRFPRPDDIERQSDWASLRGGLKGAISGLGELVKSQLLCCDPLSAGAAAVAGDAAATDEVEVAVVGPSLVAPGASVNIAALAYSAAKHESAIETFLSSFPKRALDATLLGCSAEPLTVTREENLTFMLRMTTPEGAAPGFGCQVQTQKWTGGPAVASFDFDVPEDAPQGVYQCSLSVVQDAPDAASDVQIDSVQFHLRVGDVEEKRPVLAWPALGCAIGETVRNAAAGLSLIKEFCGAVGRQLAAPRAAAGSERFAALASMVVPLVRRLQQTAPEDRRMPVAALAVLARSAENCDAILAAGGVEVLVDLAGAGSPEERAQAMAALQQLLLGPRAAAVALLCALAFLSQLSRAAASSSAALQGLGHLPDAQTLAVPSKQLGTGCSSNNAGDGPEKTRGATHWFARFKSTVLGDFRGQPQFVCCLCAVPEPRKGRRFKPEDLAHCACGRDQWQLAKAEEDRVYRERAELVNSQAVVGGQSPPSPSDCSGGGGSSSSSSSSSDDEARPMPQAKRRRVAPPTHGAAAAAEDRQVARLREENEKLQQLVREQQAMLALSPPSPASPTPESLTLEYPGVFTPRCSDSLSSEDSLMVLPDAEALLLANDLVLSDSWLEPALDLDAEASLLQIFADPF